jgi:hypothetical protein
MIGVRLEVEKRGMELPKRAGDAWPVNGAGNLPLSVALKSIADPFSLLS